VALGARAGVLECAFGSSSLSHDGKDADGAETTDLKKRAAGHAATVRADGDARQRREDLL
jgi:hypothetical protein